MDSKNYWKLYYERNKERLSEKKRQRYKTDASYREALKKSAKLRATLYKASKRLAKTDKIKTIYGLEEPYFSLKAMSRFVGLDYTILRKWQSTGFVPQPIYFKGKRGIYSESQARYLRDFIEELKRNEVYLTYVDLKVFLKKIWKLPYKGKEFSNELITKLFKEVSKYEEIKNEE